MADVEAFRKLHPQEFYRRFLAQGVRPDGRSFDKVRKTIISGSSVGTAEGSALVKIGNTSAIAGIKIEVGIPDEDTPRNGRVVVNVETPAMCSSKFKPGRPSEQAQSVTSSIQQILSSCKVVDLEDLCVEEGRAVISLYIDVVCLNHDGNLLDAALIAVLTALCDLKIPEITITDEEEVRASNETLRQLSLKQLPIPLSFGILEDKVIVDPTHEEEDLMTASFTVVCNPEGQLCSLYKPGGTPLRPEPLREAIERSKKRARDVAAKMNRAIDATKPSAMSS